MARPRKDQALDVPTRAVAAALHLLKTHAATDVSLTMVAEAVGCRPPALYGHFHNRAALLHAVHDAGFARLLTAQREAMAQAGSDPRSRLRAASLTYLRFARENPGLYRLMFDPPPRAPPDGAPVTRDPARQALTVLREALVAGQHAGIPPGADPDAAAITLWSLLHGMASLLVLDRVPAAHNRSTDTMITQAVDLVVTRIGAAPPGLRPMASRS
ncbi:TetR/AcrR family transcriptional regulator [Roseospira visakhapatnamensis]|uniref:AcrR family transcriptional regulator n=1 Tax=Roseospira visakhapatnamensis TaxID=390880 RepID=A0A7W6RHI5_9PROT|nr:TetR/AcrR family transcriptional regulator [Roseospira visakhapatnamensis]MBB4268096.1 AcrR family transcriptional regulator [Roseospira visakhapatnamensis]